MSKTERTPRNAAPEGTKAMSRKAAAAAYSISTWTVDELIASGQVQAKRAGRRVLVDVESMKAWYKSLADA